MLSRKARAFPFWQRPSPCGRCLFAFVPPPRRDSRRSGPGTAPPARRRRPPCVSRPPDAFLRSCVWHSKFFVYLCSTFQSPALAWASSTRKDGRVVDYSSLENCRAERHRGFESLSFRNFLTQPRRTLTVRRPDKRTPFFMPRSQQAAERRAAPPASCPTPADRARTHPPGPAHRQAREKKFRKSAGSSVPFPENTLPLPPRPAARCRTARPRAGKARAPGPAARPPDRRPPTLSAQRTAPARPLPDRPCSLTPYFPDA